MADRNMRLQLILDAIDRASPEIKQASNSMTGLGSSMGAVRSAAAALGPLLAGLSFASVGRAVFDVAREFQTLHASLVTVTGSQQAASAAFSDIRDFARETPYQVQEITQAFIKLKALGLDPSQEALRSYGNTASAMGKSLDQMIEAVADAATGEFERLKEFGIKARQQGDDVSFTFRGVTTTVRKNAADIEDYLRRIGDVEFAGGMARQMETLDGKMSNLADAWDGLLSTLGKTGAVDAAADSIDNLATILTRIDNAMNRKGFRDFVEFVKGGWEWNKNLVAEFGPFAQTLGWLDSLAKYHGLGSDSQEGVLFPGPPRPGRDQESERPSDASATYSGPTLADDLAAFAPELERAQKNFDDLMARVDRYVDQELRRMRKETRQLETDTEGWSEALAGLTLSLESTDEIMARVTEGLALHGEATEETEKKTLALVYTVTEATTALEASWQSFGDNFTAALTDSLSEGKAAWGDYFAYIAEELARMALSQYVTGPLFNAIGAGISGLFNTPSTAPLTGFSPSLDTSSFNLGSNARFQVKHDGGPVMLPRFHFGGLLPDEVPTILQTGERVLSRQQNRTFEKLAAALDGGGGGGSMQIVINNSGEPAQVKSARQTNGAGGMRQLVIELESALGARIVGTGSALSRSLEAAYPGLRRTGGA